LVVADQVRLAHEEAELDVGTLLKGRDRTANGPSGATLPARSGVRLHPADAAEPDGATVVQGRPDDQADVADQLPVRRPDEDGRAKQPTPRAGRPPATARPHRPARRQSGQQSGTARRPPTSSAAERPSSAAGAAE